MPKKEKKVSKVQESKTKDDNLVVNVETLLVPMSVLISGLMVSLAIIFSFRGVNLTTLNTQNPTGTDTTVTGTDPSANDGTIAEVSIDDDPYQGNRSKAKVAIIEFSDYECPFCKRHFTEVYPQIYKDYVKTNKAIYVFRDLPLSFHDPIATSEALAAQCAFDQGGSDAYFKYHDAIFNKTESNATNMTVDILKDLAKKQKGINYNKFVECLDSKKFADEVAQDMADAAAVNIGGTPGFVIGKLESDGTVKNGVLLGGAYPFENFKSAIDSFLE